MRSNAVDHVTLAQEHGFSLNEAGAPFIVADGLLGHEETEVEIEGEFYRRVPVAGILADVQAIISEWAYPQIDSEVQLEHAERIGMGSREYELREV